MKLLYTIYSSGPEELLAFIILVVVVFAIPMIITKKQPEKKQEIHVPKDYDTYPTVSDKNLRNFGFENRDQLTHKLERIFLELEKETSKQNTKRLKEICVTTLYNEINSNIKEQKKDQIKNVIRDIKITKRKLVQISKVGTRIEVKMLVGVQTIKYQEIKGKKCDEKEYNDEYLIDFIRDDITSDGRTDECKNCGAPIKNGETTCPYCDRKTGNIRKYEEWSIKDKKILS